MSGDARCLTDQELSDIDEAAYWIGKQLKRWGRVSVRQTKEKFGTARVYCTLGFYGLHCITHPGYVYSQYPKWLWHLEIYYFPRVIIPISNLIVIPYHRWLYRKVYQLAMKKWPHVSKNILHGADFSELLNNLTV